MSIAPLVMLGALLSLLLNLLKAVRSKDTNTVVTILAGMAIGVAVVFLASAALITSHHLLINGIPLNKLDAGSKVFIGLLATGLFSTVHDITSAINNQSSPAATRNTIMPLTPPVVIASPPLSA